MIFECRAGFLHRVLMELCTFESNEKTAVHRMQDGNHKINLCRPLEKEKGFCICCQFCCNLALALLLCFAFSYAIIGRLESESC